MNSAQHLATLVTDKHRAQHKAAQLIRRLESGETDLRAISKEYLYMLLKEIVEG